MHVRVHVLRTSKFGVHIFGPADGTARGLPRTTCTRTERDRGSVTAGILEGASSNQAPKTVCVRVWHAPCRGGAPSRAVDDDARYRHPEATARQSSSCRGGAPSGAVHVNCRNCRGRPRDHGPMRRRVAPLRSSVTFTTRHLLLTRFPASLRSRQSRSTRQRRTSAGATSSSDDL